MEVKLNHAVIQSSKIPIEMDDMWWDERDDMAVILDMPVVFHSFVKIISTTELIQTSPKKGGIWMSQEFRINGYFNGLQPIYKWDILGL